MKATPSGGDTLARSGIAVRFGRHRRPWHRPWKVLQSNGGTSRRSIAPESRHRHRCRTYATSAHLCRRHRCLKLSPFFPLKAQMPRDGGCAAGRSAPRRTRHPRWLVGEPRASQAARGCTAAHQRERMFWDWR